MSTPNTSNDIYEGTDALAGIVISGLQLEDDSTTLSIYDGGNVWYSVIGWVEDPKHSVHRQSRIDELVTYFPRVIDESDLSYILHMSPINKENMMKRFHQVEKARISIKTRVGNAKCPMCKGEANRSTDQTRGGDEASTITTKCLDASCGYMKKS